jgi:cobyrinic acid a,c-diamide synthase
MIAAPSSGSGKTTVARGLMSALHKRGLKVQPFKCGPDYIDTKFHNAVCGQPSVNLDLFMASEEHVKNVFNYYSAHADVAIVEGMMGLYDGFERYHGSSADISTAISVPVVLVIDAKAAAYSMAPLIFGFMKFAPQTNICGIIFNKTGSAIHEKMLREVCDDLKVECLGCLPKCEEIEQKSRYLGLDFSEDARSEQLSELIEKHIDIDRLLEMTATNVDNDVKPIFDESHLWHVDGQIAVARNTESFSFIYQEHVDLLRNMGKLTFFDPEKNEPLPADTTLLYLPGGYPEKHLEALSKAEATLSSIREYINKGGKTIAECGGMMYLCREIISDDGAFDMVGILPSIISARKEDKKLSLGYRQMDYNGLHLLGHEFHYTQFSGSVPPSIAQVYNAKNMPVTTPVMRVGNTIASYTHLYWGESDIKKLF